MLDTLFFLLIGAFIGWNFPQPTYMKLLQQWIVEKWNAFKNNSTNHNQ